MPDILADILAVKAREIEMRSAALPFSEIEKRCESAEDTRGFEAALEAQISAGNPGVIGEIKKASPSRGIIREDFDPAAIAESYARHGAACLSTVTDESHFQGRDEFLGAAKNACALPVIRKDFIIDPYQVYEARLIGADAVLLIAAALDDAALFGLSDLALSLSMDVLIEVHDRPELDRALSLPCNLIGINNRNLRTFETSLQTTLGLLEHIPPGKTVITESGIWQPQDVALMRNNSVHGFLVGEALMRADSPGEKLRDLFFGPQSFPGPAPDSPARPQG